MLGRVFALSCALGAVSCNVADPPDPFPLGPPSEPQHSGEQAEVTTALARTLNAQDILVAAYRFTGGMPFGTTGLRDIEYGANNTLTFRDGASLMGYSTTFDGIAWTKGVKIFPHLVQTFVGSVAILWGDPGVAAGINYRPLVVYSALAISKEGFDARKGGDGALHCWPGTSSPSIMCATPSIVDSVCVAVSIDGALSFPWLYCKRPSDIGYLGTDQPSIGVGAGDRIFVVVDDFANQKLDLYELSLFSPPYFFPVSVDSQMGTASHTPRIAVDQDGELWLAASTGDSMADVRLCHIRPATSTSPGSCEFVGNVTKAAYPFPVLCKSNIGRVRTGQTVSFAANRVRTEVPVLAHTDFYFAYHRDFLADILHLGATECRLPVLGAFACKDVGAWGTGSAAQQIQPVLKLIDRSEARDGSLPDVQYAYYHIDDPAEVLPGRARVRRARLFGSPFTSVPPSALIDDLPVAPDPAVCTAKYAPNYEYWGDFFGFHYAFGRHVVVYSSNEPRLFMPGCSPQTHSFQGHPLHLQSWFWPD